MSSDCSYRAYRHVVSADGIDEIHDRKSRWLCSHHANAIDVRIHRHLLPPSRQKPTEDALAQEHPQWVFGGLVAVSAYGFEHQWHLHDDCITIVTSDHGSRQCHQRLRHVYMPDMNNPKTHYEASGLSLIDVYKRQASGRFASLITRSRPNTSTAIFSSSSAGITRSRHEFSVTTTELRIGSRTPDVYKRQM